MRGGLRTILGAGAVLAMAGVALAGEKPSLSDLLPPDTLAFAEMDSGAMPGAVPAPPKRGGVIDIGLQAMQSLGVLGDDAGMVADIVGLVGEATSRRNCVGWLDAELAEAGGKLDCKAVQLVWVIETDQPGEMVERITRMVSHLATRGTAKQAIKRAGEGQREYVEFRDARWPGWVTLAWAQEAGGEGYGARFVLALGSGAMEHYLADRPVGGVPWAAGVKVAEQGMAAGGGGGLVGRVCVIPLYFRQRFPQVVEKTGLGRMFAGLGLQEAEMGVFTARATGGRMIEMQSAAMRSGKVEVVPWTVKVGENDPILRAVPEEATGVMVLKVEWPVVYERVVAVCDAALTDPTDVPVGKQIEARGRQVGVDVKRDILGHLQPWVLVHDAPRHPLRLPLMVTAVAAAEPGSEEGVKGALEKMVEGLGSEKAVGPVVEAGGADAAKKESAFKLRVDGEGTRYVQYGLVGPSWGWSGGRLVVSWSPGAVRMNKGWAGKVTSRAFGGK